MTVLSVRRSASFDNVKNADAWKELNMYDSISRSFRTDPLERELQMV